MLFLKIAYRNVIRNKRRSILSGISISVGYILVSFSLSLADGSYARIIDMLTRDSVGHIQIHGSGYRENPSLYKNISSWNRIKKILEKEKEIIAFSPRLYVQGLSFNKNRSIGISIIGINSKLEKNNTKILDKLIDGRIFSSDKYEVLISKKIADHLRHEIGDELVVITQGADGSIANEIFQIVGIIETKNSTLSENTVLMNISKLQEFIVLKNKIHEVAISLKDHSINREYTKKLRSVLDLKNINIEPWQVVRDEFYKAMMADKKGNVVTLFIIMLMVGIGVLNSILMNIMERTREYGLLKAVGTRPISVFKIIMYESFLLSLFSVIPAFLISFGINYWFSIHGIIIEPPMEYGGVVFNSMSCIINFDSFFTPFLIVMGTSLIVSLYPAFRAAIVVPCETLRDLG